MHNMQPLHLDAEASESGQILVNSTFTFNPDTTVGTLVANLGFDKVVTPKPTFIGDTLTYSSEVVEMREQVAPGTRQRGVPAHPGQLALRNGAFDAAHGAADEAVKLAAAAPTAGNRCADTST